MMKKMSLSVGVVVALALVVGCASTHVSQFGCVGTHVSQLGCASTHVNQDSVPLFRYKIPNNNGFADETGKFPMADAKDGTLLVPESKSIRFDGKKSYIILPKTENIHITEKGASFCAAVKFLDNGKTPGSNETHDMILFKQKEFLLGRDKSRVYFNFYDGAKWTEGILGGDIEPGKWTHVAAVVERLNDVAQGEVGYKVTLFINGEPQISRKFRDITLNMADSLIEVGKGWGGPWFLNGEIAEVSMYDKALTDGEVFALALSSPLIKFEEKGFVQLSSSLNKKFNALAEKTQSLTARWALASLERAGKFGYEEKRLAEDINKLEKIILEEKDESVFLKRWNDSGSSAKILVTENMLAMLIAGASVHCPLTGVMDRKNSREIFAGIPISWSVEYFTGNSKKAEILSSSDDFIPGKISGITEFHNGASFDIEWENGGVERPFKFKAKSSFLFRGNRMEADFNIQNMSPDITVSEVVFPFLRFSKLDGSNDTLVYPWMSGVLVKNPTMEQFVFGQENTYPSGAATMQFAAYYDNRSGVYFAFEDPQARTKFFSVKGKGNNLEVFWKSPAGIEVGKKGGNNYRTSGKAAVELFSGDWFDAGQIYKRWLAGNASWWIKELPRKDSPEWFRNNCFWILNFSVKGKEETDALMLKDLTAIRKYIDMPFGVHWYGWDDMGKAGWPHFYPRAGVESVVKTLTENGIYVKPYIDSRLWQEFDGPKGEKKDWMFGSHGKSYAVKERNGEMSYETYDKLKYMVMCPASEGWQNWMTDMSLRVAGYGFSAIYHDQVATAKPILCFDSAHGHALGGGEVWLEKGYWPMYRKIWKEIKSRYPQMAFDTEENSEPYLSCFDGFMPWRWTDYNQVPLFVSIYAGRVQFTGRLFDHHNPGSPESSFIKCAEQLVNAEQIGWFTLSEFRMPGLKKLFTKKMCHLRYALLSWFNEADMLHPLRFKKELDTITTAWGTVGDARKITTPKLRHSVWKRKEGVMIVFVNSVNEKLAAFPEIDAKALGFGNSPMRLTACRDGAENSDVRTVPEESFQSVELAPLSTEVWFLAPAGWDNDAMKDMIEKTSSILKSMKNFNQGDYRMDVKDTAVRDAYSGRWIDYKEAAAFFGAVAGKDYIGWIESDSIVYFGTVDFGDKNVKRKLDVEIAVSPQYEGGCIEFFADSPVNGTLIGKFHSLESSGGFDKFTVFSVPAKDIKGRHKVFVKFSTTGCCNFKRWRIFETR